MKMLVSARVGYKCIEIKGKQYHIPEKEIEQSIQALDISEFEAIEMWLDDHDITTNQEVEELTKKAKANKTDKIVVQSKVEKAKTERKPRENPLKTALIEYLYKFLMKNSSLLDVKITNNTKSIDFIAENKHFTLNLVEHRPKKDK